MSIITAKTSAAVNVLLGWMGVPIPQPVKHRNKSRANYRKTARKRVTK
jgi:hypothetical protein